MSDLAPTEADRLTARIRERAQVILDLGRRHLTIDTVTDLLTEIVVDVVKTDRAWYADKHTRTVQAKIAEAVLRERALTVVALETRMEKERGRDDEATSRDYHQGILTGFHHAVQQVKARSSHNVFTDEAVVDV